MMAAYDYNGNNLEMVFDASSDALPTAYDIEGNAVFSSGEILKVMTFNVQRFTDLNSNQQMLATIYDLYKPDIIGIQELAYSQSIPSAGQAFLAPYDYYAIGSQYLKTGFFSKIQLLNTSYIQFEGDAAISQTYGYQKCYFKFNNKQICWINAHLVTSNNESQKVKEAEIIFDAVQNEEYFVITGDFNTVCKSVRDEEYTTIMKQFVDAGYHSANCSNQHGFIDTWTAGSTASGTWYPCDHVITSANISINNVVVDTSKITVAEQTGQSIDHLPLVADLTIN